MSVIKSFDQLTQHLAQLSHRPRVAVVAPYDEDTCEGVAMALDQNLIEAVLVGERDKVMAGGLPARFGHRVEIVSVADKLEAAATAVALAHDGKVDILMKGLIGTDDLLRAILNKEHGLLPKGQLLTHLTASEIPGMGRLLFMGDVAVIPYPTIEQREQMLRLDLGVIRRFGIECPKVALIHFTEKVNPKFPNSVDYTRLIEMAGEGAFGCCELAGPMDVKTALDAHSAKVKGLTSQVCGHADLLIFPNIESGNTFYKSVSLFAHATMAGILVGPKVPVVLPSRADSARSKFYSLAMASVASDTISK